MTQPTPIPISKTSRNLTALVAAAILLFFLWEVPVILVISLGGLAVALVLSFPVRLLLRIMPRGLAISLAFLIFFAVLLFVFYVLSPLLINQVGALIQALPDILRNLAQYLTGVLQALDKRGLLPGTPREVVTHVADNLRASFDVITRNALGGTVGLVFGTFNFILTLFGIIFVAASLLSNARHIKKLYLASTPSRYRRDAVVLWNTLAHALSHYIGGLGVVLAIQGVLSTVALYLIGVPYALALGAWVAVSAVIPYLGAWIGAIPAILVALSISPKAVILTALVFLAIQQLEGNVLTPWIQGRTLQLPSVTVFLAVITGGALAGIPGVLFAVPVLAVLRVLFDFFRVRLRTVPAHDGD